MSCMYVGSNVIIHKRGICKYLFNSKLNLGIEIYSYEISVVPGQRASL